MEVEAAMRLRDYQEVAADFIYENDKTLILAKVGAGKTALTLTAMRDMLADGIVKRWLVVAPRLVATDVWPTEAALWAPSLRVNVAVGTSAQRRAAFDTPSDVVVINYDTLQWFAEQDVARRFDGMVLDELTRMKNPGAQKKDGSAPKHGKRFAAFFEAVKHIEIRVGLTGSFTSNGLEDCYGQVRIIDPTRLGRSKGAFLQQFFWSANPAMGEWIPRPGALKMIMDKIKPITFLLEAKEYADTLPPLTILPVKCEMDMQPYKEMKRNLVLELGGATITAVNAGVMTQKLRQLASGFVYDTQVTPSNIPGKFITTKTPHWISKHKFAALEALLRENHYENTLIFYQYQEELAELRRRYPHAEVIDAPDASKRWNAGQIPLLLAHPDSAQYGLNLQHGGCSVVYLSLPWSQTAFEQSYGRLHRSGQKHEVRVYHIETKGTIDELVMLALQDKKTLAEIAIEALK